MSADTPIGYILFGDFGILTMSPTYLLGMLFPLITIFYFVTTCLEASGIFAKIANKCNKTLAFFGLSGYSLFPMLMGLGCVTVALASLDTVKNKREKFIASALLCILVPCSAQVAIIIALAFLIGPAYFLFYVFVIASTFLVLSVTLNALTPKEYQSPCCFHEHPLKLPEFGKALKRAVISGISFLKETALPFMAGSVVVSILKFLNVFAVFSAWLSPFTEGFLRLPREAANLFILSILKRDLGAAGFLAVIQSGAFSSGELVVSLIIMTLFVPCFASVVILLKQEKLPTAISIWAGSFVISMIVGKLASLLIL
ncbi:MAG: hypothetical protein FWD00_00435 [Clostridiales bacterium]|nr:hypothetical protein [Clostridiales bacterium]